MVRPGKEQYPSTIKLKILTKPDGTFVPESYSMQKQPVPLDSIEKGNKAMAIVDLNQIWFIDNKFGVTIRLQQALFEQSAKLPSFAFPGSDLPDDDFRLMLRMRMRLRKLMISKKIKNINSSNNLSFLVSLKKLLTNK